MTSDLSVIFLEFHISWQYVICIQITDNTDDTDNATYLTHLPINLKVWQFLLGRSTPYMHPKSRHCQKGGGVLPLARIFLEDLSTMPWGPSKVIIYHPRVIISPQKCAPIPQNKSFSHIYLTSQKWFTYVVLSENVASRIYSLWLVN